MALLAGVNCRAVGCAVGAVQVGSGNVGGRNAGRVLGRAGFVIVAVVDALKGLLAVLFASTRNPTACPSAFTSCVMIYFRSASSARPAVPSESSGIVDPSDGASSPVFT